jgi:hypothetical protein
MGFFGVDPIFDAQFFSKKVLEVRSETEVWRRVSGGEFGKRVLEASSRGEFREMRFGRPAQKASSGGEFGR